MANLMVHYLRKKDAEAQEKGEVSMIKKSEVIHWYVEEVLEKDIENTEELLEKKQIVSKVIHNLMYKDKILIPLNKTGLAKKGASAEGESDDEVLVVHPNYVTDL